MTDAKPPAARDELLQHIPSLRAFAVSLSGQIDRADDLVQETLVKAWRNLGSFTEGTNMRAWLFTILRNVYISDIRRRRREVQDSEGAFAEGVAVAPQQNGHMDLADFQQGAGGAAGRAARGADPDRRGGVLLRGGGRNLRLRGRHGQEPRQPRPQRARQASQSGSPANIGLEPELRAAIECAPGRAGRRLSRRRDDRR